MTRCPKSKQKSCAPSKSRYANWSDIMTVEEPRITALQRTFIEQFGAPAEFTVRAPGRVNLIGEHTDYNEGFVFPTAIDRSMIIAASHNNSDEVVACSLDYN